MLKYIYSEDVNFLGNVSYFGSLFKFLLLKTVLQFTKIQFYMLSFVRMRFDDDNFIYQCSVCATSLLLPCPRQQIKYIMNNSISTVTTVSAN